MKIFLILFYLQENLQRTANFGSNMLALIQRLELMSSIFRSSLRLNFKKNRLEKRVFAQNEKNFMLNVLMNLLDKLQFHVLNKVFFLYE